MVSRGALLRQGWFFERFFHSGKQAVSASAADYASDKWDAWFFVSMWQFNAVFAGSRVRGGGG